MSPTSAPDIFISYAHVDNASRDKAVDRFVEELEALVNQQVGRSSPNRIWKDNRLDGNRVFSSDIQQKLKNANCLLIFLSPGYLASEWCMKEFNLFHEKNRPHPERIFCVELDAIPVEDKPAILQESLGYRFWHQDKLSKVTYPLEPENKDYKNTLLKLAKDLAEQIKQFEETVRQAKQAGRNNAHSEAIDLWRKVLKIQPEYPGAVEEITSLQQKQQQHSQGEQLLLQLFARMQDIPQDVFANVAKVLRDIDNHTKAQTIIEKTEQFLQNTITADHYIAHCQEELSGKTPQIKASAMDYDELAKRIRNGDTVLFLGSEIPREYGEDITDEHVLARHLAEKIGYENFNGSFSSIAEYYQLRPEYGRKSLLDKLKETLFQKPSVVRFYNHLARIEQPLVLIASSYDDMLEKAFRQHQKPYVVLSSIINRGQDDDGNSYDVGHVLVRYSDNKEPEKIWLAEELSQLKLMEEGYSLIYKIKGTCENCHSDNPFQKDALLISESNYFTFARNADKIIPGYLVKHFQDRGFMFIGFNPKSWEDRLLVNALLEKRRYISTPCYTAGTSEDPLEAAYWDNQKVRQYDISIRQLDEKLEQVLA